MGKYEFGLGTNEQLGKCENFIYVQVKLKASLAVK